MTPSSKGTGIVSFTAEYRSELIARAGARERAGEPATYVKTARIVALQIPVPFVVQTEHGPISADAGDWLATNHPADDDTSDIWPISAKRFEASYVPSPDFETLKRAIIRDSTLGEVAGEPVPYIDAAPSASSPVDASPRAAHDDLLQKLADHMDGFHTGECHCRRDLEAILPVDV